MYEVRVNEWERRRDFFTADIVSVLLNNRRAKDTDHSFTADEILGQKYEKANGSVVTTPHDPDRGAEGNWKGLKQALKGTTEKNRRKREKRPRPMES